MSLSEETIMMRFLGRIYEGRWQGYLSFCVIAGPVMESAGG